MVEVQVVGFAADDAASLVALPHLQFYGRRNHPDVRQGVGSSCRYVEVLSQLKSKLEDRPGPITFSPRIGKSEKTVERPDSDVNLLVDGDYLGGLLSSFRF